MHSGIIFSIPHPIPMSVFETIRHLVAQGDPEHALQRLVQYISGETQDKETLRLLRILESRLNAAKQKERKGTLDTEAAQKEYNIVSDALLGVVDDLEAGRRPALSNEVTGAADSNSKKLWWIGIAILVLLAVITGVLISQSKKPSTIVVQAPGEKAAEEKKCPDFNEKGIRVLLIPFQNLRNDAGSKPEVGIQSRIRTLTRNNSVDSDIEILQGKRFENNTPDEVQAKKVGLNCQADLVIWGQYEMIGDEINVDMQYVFTKAPNLPSGEVSDTFKSLSELKSNKMKFTNLEQAVLSLCSIMVLHEGNTALADKWLKKLTNPSPGLKKIEEMLQEVH